MMFDTNDEIIDLIIYNLHERCMDYKLYHRHLPILTLNINKGIITYPKYNIYQDSAYFEPNRYKTIIDTIHSLPNFKNLSDFINIISLDKYQSFRECFFSKGIERLKGLHNLIMYGIISNDNQTIHIENINYDNKILLIGGWIMCNQVFTDGNHRTAKYIIENYISINNFNADDFIEMIKSKRHLYRYNDYSWIINMNELIRISVNYKFKY